MVRRDGGPLAVTRRLRIEEPEREPVACSGARSSGPGRPEGDTPVTTPTTGCGTHPARGGGQTGTVARRADGCPSASVVVRAPHLRNVTTAPVNGNGGAWNPSSPARLGARKDRRLSRPPLPRPRPLR